MQLVKLEHIPDGHPVTTARYNALVDVINALAEVVKAQGQIDVAKTAKAAASQTDPRKMHKYDNRQAKPR
jgi:hypothetical protein